MIKDFLDKIKRTKKIANERNIHNWHNILFQGILMIFATSLLLSLITLLYLDGSSFGQILTRSQASTLLFPIFYTALLSYLFLEKIIIGMILLFEKMNKYLFRGWQKYDMWYYRKHRKTSPLTENISKIQQKATKLKLTKTKRIIITISLIILVVITNFLQPLFFNEPVVEPVIMPDDQLVQIPLEDESQIIVNGVG